MMRDLINLSGEPTRPAPGFPLSAKPFDQAEWERRVSGMFKPDAGGPAATYGSGEVNPSPPMWRSS